MTKVSSCGGGGWTLVMKIRGEKENFRYDSELWTNNKSYNLAGGATGFDLKETKLPTYHTTPFSKICLGMKVNGQDKYIVLKKEANSLYELISDGRYRATDFGRDKWKKLNPNTDLQRYCNMEGFNAMCKSSGRALVSARIGILNECNYCDSWIGFGTEVTYFSDISCGSTSNLGTSIAAMGYILVQ